MISTIILCLLLVENISAYSYPCLELCECDTEEEVIDCHRKGLTSFPELTSGYRLRGFVVMSLLDNDINPDTIPTEADILKRYPDLKVIDLAGNSQVDCEDIESKFSKIGVMTDCEHPGGKNEGGERENVDGGDTATGEVYCDPLCKFNNKLFKPAYLTAYAGMKAAWYEVSEKTFFKEVIDFFKG